MELLEQLAQELTRYKSMQNGGLSMKAVSGPTVPPNHIYGHGAGGLFNTPAVERGLFSAIPLPRKGLQSMLPVFPSQNDDPRVGILTGVTESDPDPATNDAIAGECGRGPSAGLLKYCVIYNYPFGDFSRSTRSVNIRKAGRMATRVDTMDYGVIGNPFNPETSQNLAPGFGGLRSIGEVANNEGAKSLFELGVEWQRDFAKVFYNGNPDAAFFEWSKPYRGMDLLINDTYSDFVSGNACDRVDSYVAAFSDFTGGGGNDVESNPNAMVQAVNEISNLLYRRAAQMGVDPMRLALSMPYNLFRKLAYIWPCSFYTNLCAPSTGYVGNLNAVQQVELTQQILAEKFLPVMGAPGGRIPVVCDDAIEETDLGGGVKQSRIKFVCTHVLDSTIVTYMEFFDYGGVNGAMDVARRFGQQANYQTYDNGRFLAHFIAPEGTCIEVAFYMEPRLRVDAPWLCADLNTIEYSPIIPQDSAFPGDPEYLNGGNTGPNPGAPGTFATITACVDNAPGIVDFTLNQVLNCTLGTNVLVTTTDNVTLPGVITAGNNSTSVTIDFTAVAGLATLVCADFLFVNGSILCNF